MYVPVLILAYSVEKLEIRETLILCWIPVKRIIQYHLCLRFHQMLPGEFLAEIKTPQYPNFSVGPERLK
jgi:hypothetical protein